MIVLSLPSASLGNAAAEYAVLRSKVVGVDGERDDDDEKQIFYSL